MYYITIPLLMIIVYIIIPSIIIKCIGKKNLRNLNDNNKLYLTFDDGPDEKTTNLVLNILKKNNIKATFFLVGVKVKNNIETFESIRIDGHSIGMHSFYHYHPWKKSPFKILKDIIDEIQFYKSINIYNKRKIYRPPYGKVNAITLIYLLLNRHKIILWDKDPKDFKNKKSEQQINSFVSNLKNGSIILLHDGSEKGNTVKLLNRIIVYAKNNKLKLCIID